MMKFYNSGFQNESVLHDYLNYGCNCFLEGNWGRLSDPGHGAPIDPLDTTCYDYKECLTEVKNEFGKSCKPENVDYRYGKYSLISGIFVSLLPLELLSGFL